MPFRKTRFEPGNRVVSGSPKLGAFLGVYTPTILTILGVIMHLRFGWLVGHMGLDRTLLIVVFVKNSSLFTGELLHEKDQEAKEEPEKNPAG